MDLRTQKKVDYNLAFFSVVASSPNLSTFLSSAKIRKIIGLVIFFNIFNSNFVVESQVYFWINSIFFYKNATLRFCFFEFEEFIHY